ncbi:MAG: hypothetical protein ACYCT7_01475 [bacterium]
MTEEEFDQNKKIAHYSNSLNAWFNTQLELDKSFLILSTAAIGFIVSLFKYFKMQSECDLIFGIFSIFSFLLCIILTLITFNKNTSILENLFENNSKGLEKDEKSLQILGLITSISFILGIFFSLVYVWFSI